MKSEKTTRQTKFRYEKWPVAITFEVAEDWWDGIDAESDGDIVELKELQEATDQAAEYMIAAKGIILAQQEAKRKQAKED